MLHPQILPDPPGKIPAYLWRNGRLFYPIPHVARIRQCSRQAVYKWARNNPDVCYDHNGHTYIWEQAI